LKALKNDTTDFLEKFEKYFFDLSNKRYFTGSKNTPYLSAIME